MPQNKISTYRRNRIFAYFRRDVTATAAARANRNTANYYCGKIRTLILQSSLPEGGMETGEFEADEPYFECGARPGKVRGAGRPDIRKNREKLL